MTALGLSQCLSGKRFMLQARWRGAVGIIVSGIVAAAVASAAGADGPATPQAGRPASVAHLPPKAARMYGFVTKPHPGELKWQQIPWLTDLREAIRQAKANAVRSCFLSRVMTHWRSVEATPPDSVRVHYPTMPSSASFALRSYSSP